MGKLSVIQKQIEKKKESIIKLKMSIRKENTKKRLNRKKKLISLGSLFYVLDLLEESQEIMLGFLLMYKELTPLEKENYLSIGAELLENRKKEDYSKDIEKRKILFYKMIKKSALLEKLKIYMEDPKIILGFLSTYQEKSLDEKKKYEEIGKEMLNIKKNIDNRIISDKEKLEILRISIEKKINLTKILKEKYKKDIHSLKNNEYKEIINFINK